MDCLPIVLTVATLFSSASGMRATGGGTAKHLCAPEIVEETCSYLTGKDSVNADDLQAVLSADQDSIVHAWQALGLPGTGSIVTRSSKVTCAELCNTLIQAAADWQIILPPRSDVGCYHDGEEVICDLDLSPERISTLIPRGKQIPDMHDAEVLVHTKAAGQKRSEEKWPPLDNVDREAKQRAAQEISYSVEQVIERLMNLFRIFATFEATAKTSSLLQWGWGTGTGNTQHRKEIAQRSKEAEAYVTQALKKFRSRQTQVAISKWFGANAFQDKDIRKEIQRVLNSIHEMLDNVEYVYPGDACSPRTYAYVYPQGEYSKNKEGKYIFYLCDLYIQSPISEQIETLTHEGSHHATAYTTDVCMDNDFYVMKPKASYYQPSRTQVFKVDGEYMEVVHATKTDVIFEPFDKECDDTAYGRKTCIGLAQDSSDLALLNADNFCYYIQDVTDVTEASKQAQAPRKKERTENSGKYWSKLAKQVPYVRPVNKTKTD